MFKNLIVYRITEGWTPDVGVFESQLAKDGFVPCGASQPASFGWLPPRGAAHGPLVEIINGQWLLKLGREQRLLPSSVIAERVDEIAEQIEQQTGRKPGKKARKELKEQATLELLPRAFTKSSATKVWIAPAQRLVMIDAGSASRADEIVSLLVKASAGLSLQLVQTAESPAACMAAWLMDGVAPAGFGIEREAELKGSDEHKPVVRYARHALDIEEVRQHLTAGKLPTRLALNWRDRVSFTLTESLQLKKITFLDLVFEDRVDPANPEEAFDADAALATGELAKLIPELIEGLGGEHDFAAASSVAAQPAQAEPAQSAESVEAAPWD